MGWPSTCAWTPAACQCANRPTSGKSSTNANFHRRRRRTEGHMVKDACSREKTGVASAQRPSANAVRDFREENKDRKTYRCLKAFLGWFLQRDCNYAVKDPDHDKCWRLTWAGECKRED